MEIETTYVVRPILKVDIKAENPQQVRDQVARIVESLAREGVSVEGWDLLSNLSMVFSSERFVAAQVGDRWRVMDTSTGQIVPASGGSAKCDAELEAKFLNE